jgi:F-type H+-transporting ATPase subunit c
MKEIGVGLTTTALAGAGIGIGHIFSAFLTSFAINPRIKSDLFTYTILGFAFVEALALFSLLLAFLLLYT